VPRTIKFVFNLLDKNCPLSNPADGRVWDWAYGFKGVARQQRASARSPRRGLALCPQLDMSLIYLSIPNRMIVRPNAMSTVATPAYVTMVSVRNLLSYWQRQLPRSVIASPSEMYSPSAILVNS